MTIPGVGRRNPHRFWGGNNHFRVFDGTSSKHLMYRRVLRRSYGTFDAFPWKTGETGETTLVLRVVPIETVRPAFVEFALATSRVGRLHSHIVRDMDRHDAAQDFIE